jgi:multiple sugar transport system substrate-binding protein
LKRREFLTATAAVCALGKLSSASAATSNFGSINWKQQSGTKLNVFMARHPWQEAIEPEIDQFRSLTGINVQLSELPEDQYATKVAADLSAGVFEYDVFMSQYYDAPRYEAAKWTAALDPLMNDPKLTDKNWYDWQDFFPGARQIATIGGKYADRVAITAEAQILIYRKDVLAKLGIAPPLDFNDLLAAADKIGKAGNISGITLRGGTYAWWPFYGVVKSYGGDFLTPDLKPVIDSSQDIEALQMYADLAKDAPQGVTSYDWDEINTAMLSGQAAMFLDSSVIYSRIKDPTLSTVANEIGAAPFPTGPAGRHGSSHYWSLSMAAASKREDAGWLFIQWATSKPVQALLQSKGVLAPRASVYDTSDASKMYAADFLDAVKTSLTSAVILPANAKFFELMDPLRVAIQQVIAGDSTAATSLKSVESQWQKILA